MRYVNDRAKRGTPFLHGIVELVGGVKPQSLYMIRFIFIALVRYITLVCASHPNAPLCVGGAYDFRGYCEQMLEYDEGDPPCIWLGDVPPAPPATP